MYNFKRVIALGVVSTMILGSSLTAFAEDAPSDIAATATSFIEGTGENEAGAALEAERHAFVVTVPTNDAIKQRVGYTVDLEGWIKETKGARYGLNTTAIDDSKGVLFVNYNNNKASGMSNVSSPITVTNKGTDPVMVTVTAKWKAAPDADKGITTGAANDKFETTDATKYMYMAMYTNKTGNLTAMPADTTETPMVVGVTSSRDQYVTGWNDTTKKYSYTLKENVAATALSSINVYFTGTINPAKTAADLKYTEGTGESAVTKAKAAPALTVKFAAAEIANRKDGYATFKSNTYTIGKSAEGGLTQGAITGLKIDGKTIALGTGTGQTAAPTVGTDGFFTISSETAYKAYGYTAKPTDGWVPHVIEFTNGDGTFTVELNKSK
jgi:hypothetical protein